MSVEPMSVIYSCNVFGIWSYIQYKNLIKKTFVFLIFIVVLKKTDCLSQMYRTTVENCLLGAGVLGHSLGALRDGVLGELTGEEEPDSGLDLAGGDGGPLVVVSQTGSLSSDSFEEIIDEGVHDAHGFG